MTHWRVRQVLEDGRTRVLVVEQVRLSPSASAGACHVHAVLRPEAIIISDATSTRAIDTAGQPVDIDELASRSPELREAIGAGVAASGARPPG